jgi:hypothetical protein
MIDEPQRFTRETCDHCDEAKVRVCGLFTGGCRGCAARSVARSMRYWQARASGKQDRHYRAFLDQMGVTHAQANEAYANAFHPPPRRAASAATPTTRHPATSPRPSSARPA